MDVAGRLSDGELLARHLAGDGGAFEAVVRRHAAMVLAVCRRALGESDEAEDAAQAAFLALVRKAGALSGQSDLGAWLHNAARCAATDALRTREARRRHEQEAAAMRKEAARPAQDAEAWSEIRPHLDAALGKLPAAQRRVLVACYLEGHSQSEAARALGLPEGTVAVYCRRGLERLRQRLAGRQQTRLDAVALGALLLAEAGAGAAVPERFLASTLSAAKGAAAVALPVAALVEGVLKAMFWMKVKLAAWVAAPIVMLVIAIPLAWRAGGGEAQIPPTRPAAAADGHPEPDSGIAATARPPASREEVIPDIPEGPPRMDPDGQRPSPTGGRIVLYSRNRYGNYPLASYALHLGLRGDSRSVANDVNLVFGNAKRGGAFRGQEVVSVPGVQSSGAVARDGALGDRDDFRVDLCGSNRNKMLDLGAVDYERLESVPADTRRAWGRAAVVVDHVYLIRVQDSQDPQLAVERWFKLKVLRHRDNDAVLLDWQPIGAAARLAAAADPAKLRGNGGKGGAGGYGGTLKGWDPNDPVLKCVEEGLSPEQRRLLDEYQQLAGRCVDIGAGGERSAKMAEQLRLGFLASLAGLAPEKQADRWRAMPGELLTMRRTLDPFLVRDEERAAAAKLPKEAPADVEALLSEDVETFMAARARILARGPACRAPLADRGRKLDEADFEKLLRVKGVLAELAVIEGAEEPGALNHGDNAKWFGSPKQVANTDALRRATAKAFRRAATLRGQLGPDAIVAVLVEANLCGRGGVSRSDPYCAMENYLFSKQLNQNDWGRDYLSFDWNSRFNAGRECGIKDAGDGDFSAVKTAPAPAEVAQWASSARAFQGHTYLMHCLSERNGIDFLVKFKVLDMMPKEWVVIRWEKLPQQAEARPQASLAR